MASLPDKTIIRKLRNSYVTSIISIALVLFLVGVTGVLVLNAKELSNFVKENIGFSVILNENAKVADITWLQKELDAEPAVKWTKYVTKEEAANTLKADLGSDFVAFLGYNPLPASIDVRLNAAYANPDSIKALTVALAEYPQVSEVYYQESLVDLVNKNISKISAIVLFFSVLLFLISIALINNTVRLSIFNTRFTIKTMQLIGASEWFIQRPFVQNAAINGMVGALLAIVLLELSMFAGRSEIFELLLFKNLWILYIALLFVGMTISAAASWFSVRKFLIAKKSELYY